LFEGEFNSISSLMVKPYSVSAISIVIKMAATVLMVRATLVLGNPHGWQRFAFAHSTHSS
jgi:hypothetical protein